MSPADFVPNPNIAAYIWAQVADHVQKRIEDGDLAPGTRLPNERDMALEYGVATGTIRRAIQELRERALVITLPGKGTFVAER
ncbi:winged helix-turn-helix domain-containing protein [Amycolatopsis thermoflava]|uniref:winged helix-turn-helix domain-containing protein n=1 Tax=Amycolatopsis thermoflava TaxID=84480 RepID=UPI00364ED826